ncbi:MAG: ABC transporter permease [Marinilabiliales bacterium]|nr:MAG: ABC transporter permease [Marinilabiliales bacterium]
MRIILYILQKEFIQVFRDKTMLPIIFVIPIFQLLILSYTATFEIKNVNLAVVDHDKSVMSSKIISKFSGSAFFNFKGNATTYDEAVLSLKRSEIDQILVIEQNFEKNLRSGQSPHIQIATNAINGSAASLMSAYASSIIADFNREIIVDENPTANVGLPINAQPTFWYNPELNYITYMVPGILVLLVTVIGMFLSGMNLVKEKEMGTIEQINVTPIKKYQFITGKLVPFWIIANVDLAIGLLIAYFVFSIPVVGSLPLLFGVSSVYLVAVLSLGLLVSTMTNTMQQSMFISWFLLVIFIMMSGLFTPVESMPQWAQNINYINPVAYFIKINRMIMLKGSGFADFHKEFYMLLVYAVSVLSFAIMRYRKRV